MGASYEGQKGRFDVTVGLTSPAPLCMPRCGKADETQRHLLECEALSSNSVVTSLPVYEDLFGCDHDKIRNIGVILSEKFTLFKLKPSALSHLQLCAAGGSNQQLAGDLSSA